MSPLPRERGPVYEQRRPWPYSEQTANATFFNVAKLFTWDFVVRCQSGLILYDVVFPQNDRIDRN